MLPCRSTVARCFCAVGALVSFASQAIGVSGSPPRSIAVGAAYYFKPTVTNAGGGDVQFAVRNLPEWATFARRTGVISGTPGRTGVWSDVVVEVWDGTHYGELPPFSIAVGASAAASTAMANLTWSKPTQNSDGSALHDLAGYVIRYGTALGSLDRQIAIHHPDTTEAVIDSLASGTWYFKVAAVNADGELGWFTSVVSAAL